MQPTTHPLPRCDYINFPVPSNGNNNGIDNGILCHHHRCAIQGCFRPVISEAHCVCEMHVLLCLCHVHHPPHSDINQPSKLCEFMDPPCTFLTFAGSMCIYHTCHCGRPIESESVAGCKLHVCEVEGCEKIVHWPELFFLKKDGTITVMSQQRRCGKHTQIVPTPKIKKMRLQTTSESSVRKAQNTCGNKYLQHFILEDLSQNLENHFSQ